MRKLLVISASYTLDMIKERKLEEPVLVRDLDGYFEHVWSVHPFATIQFSQAHKNAYGGVTTTCFSFRHTIIEGKIGKFYFLKCVPAINFLFAQFELLLRLSRLIKKEKINVIRCDDPQYVGLIGLLLAKMHKIPFVIRIGSNWDKYYEETGKPAMPRLFKKREIEKKVESFVFKRADLVAGANIDNLNYAIANGARKFFTTLFRYGNLIHEAHRLAPEHRAGADDFLAETGLAGQNFIIYIGRLEPVKLPDHVILTVAELQKNGHSLKCLMVGDGSMKGELMQLAEKSRLKNDIVFVGNKNQEWIARILPYAVVVLSPHTGRALTEAALAGVPIVAYNIDWQPELIKTGETGELVDYKDFQAMAVASERFLSDPVYAKEMGKNVRLAALEMMDPVKLTSHERSEYEKLFYRYRME